MKITDPQARTPSENTLPMINVVFLLLIFFMLAGAFKRPEPFDINAPTAQKLSDLQREEFLLFIDATGHVALNEQTLSLDELANAVAKHGNVLQQQGLQLKADAELDAHLLMDVIEVLASQGIGKIFLMADSE